MTPEERRARQRRYQKLYELRKASGYRRVLRPHGTLAAVSRHRRAKEPLCAECRPVYLAYRAAAKRRRLRERAAWDYWAGPTGE